MRPLLLSTFVASILLTGCSLSPTAEPTPQTGATIQGRVHGGQQPVVGASVYLYAAGTSGYGGSSVSLLNSSVQTNNPSNSGKDASGNYHVTTDSNGNFSIGSDYSCTSGQQVYLYVVGGNPGAGSNSAVGMLAILGSCPTAGNFAGATPFVFVNEVSTITAAYAFAGYATDATHVSSSGTALAQLGISNAFVNAANLASLSTGVAYSSIPAGTAFVPQTRINSLANILAACVNSTGPTSSACSTLFSSMLSAGTTGTTATDTATAAVYLAHNPGVNVSTIFAIPTPSAPFSPALPATSTPNDFTIGLNFPGLGGIALPEGIAIDGSGNAWIADFSGNKITEISSSGTLVSGNNGYSGGGLSGPWAIAIDLNGNAWISNENGNSVTEISSSGSFLSGPSGYTANATLDLPRGIAVDASNNVWIANDVGNTVAVLNNAGTVLSGTGYTGSSMDFIYFPEDIAIGPDGSAWVPNTDGNNVTRLNISGAVLSGQYGYTGGGIDDPYGIAIDGSGNGWVISIGNGDGAVTEISNTGTILSGTSGYTGGGIFRPYAIAIDGAGSAWVANEDGNDVTEISSSGAYLSGTNAYSGGDINQPAGVAVDGSGDVWLTDHGISSVTELIGAAAPVVTPLAAGVKNNALGTRP